MVERTNHGGSDMNRQTFERKQAYLRPISVRYHLGYTPSAATLTPTMEARMANRTLRPLLPVGTTSSSQAKNTRSPGTLYLPADFDPARHPSGGGLLRAF